MNDFLRCVVEFEKRIEHAVSPITKMEVLVEAAPVNTPFNEEDANRETRLVCSSVGGPDDFAHRNF